jgi:hypothetical protein
MGDHKFLGPRDNVSPQGVGFILNIWVAPSHHISAVVCGRSPIRPWPAGAKYYGRGRYLASARGYFPPSVP